MLTEEVNNKINKIDVLLHAEFAENLDGGDDIRS